MPRLLALGFTISLDGYGAGPRQSREEPLGVGGESLHDWLVHTPTFKGTHGSGAARRGDADVDEEFAARAMAGIGAWIMGRNMFGPIRGPWPDESWRGWWGQNPPYHTPVFVLTHHKRPPLEMEGGTVFHFVTDGIEAALEQARAAAGVKDIRIGGGVSTVRQYLEARLIDEIHLAVSPILLGAGEHRWRASIYPRLATRAPNGWPARRRRTTPSRRRGTNAVVPASPRSYASTLRFAGCHA